MNETCVTLEWSSPRDTGGRGDITYSLHCRKCSGDGKKCTPCGSGVHFVPRQFGLSSATVLVTDLQPDSNYSFTVESQNGVSDLSPTPRGSVVINVTTSQTGGNTGVCKKFTHTGICMCDTVFPVFLVFCTSNWLQLLLCCNSHSKEWHLHTSAGTFTVTSCIFGSVGLCEVRATEAGWQGGDD